MNSIIDNMSELNWHIWACAALCLQNLLYNEDELYYYNKAVNGGIIFG